MFSRNSEPANRRVWSITQRFTALYVASTFVLLLLAVGYLYWVLQRSLDARDHALVTSKAQVLSGLVQNDTAQFDVLVNEVEHEATGGPLRYYLRVLDPEQRVIIETPGMGQLLPLERFPSAESGLSDSLRLGSPSFRREGVFLMLSAEAQTGSTPPERRILQVALDISTDLELLADYRRKLSIVLVLALAVSALAGAWLARKGTEPILAMTRQARHVSASHLNERIGVSQWPAELAELASAFNGMLDRLEDSFNRLSRFSADIAHELRTPINNLRGEAEVALSRCRSLSEYQETLTSSLEEFDRLSRMIDGLLFIARSEDPNMAVDRIQVDARKEVEAVREFYEPLAGEQDVAIRCDGSGIIVANSMLVRRAVSNLVANSIRHTPAGGSVTIRVQSTASQSFDIAVQDTGEGIPADAQATVFDRFVRVGDSRAAGTGGTGLGLAIVQSIMRLHGGSATLRSAVGRGTTVTLHFPGGT